MNNNYLLCFLAFLCLQISNAQTSELSVEKIMQDPEWMGTFPSNVSWGAHSENIYFQYNPEKNPSDSLYRININAPKKIEKVSWQEEDKLLPRQGDFNSSRTKKVFTRNGKIFLYDLRKKQEKQLLELGSQISDVQFLTNEDRLSFIYDNNAFQYDLNTGAVKKLTNIQRGDKKEEKDKELSDQDEWLQEENLGLLGEVRKRDEEKKAREAYR